MAKRTKARGDEWLTRVRAIARECGYAIGVHGSEQRDLDLIAAPWTRFAIPAEALVERLCEEATLHKRTKGDVPGFPGEYLNPEERPHGRKSWALSGCPNHLYVDLAVMPTRPDPEDADRG